MIPTNESVFVERAGELDDWGRPTTPTLTEYKARIDYRTEIVKTDNGEDAVSKAQILFKGVVLVTVDDTVKWVDQYGEHEAKPLSVSPLKDLSSKVIFTKVVV
jgi:hypothetical protein